MEKLGKKMKDKITGFEGIATLKHICLTGHAQYGLAPKAGKDGSRKGIQYFDESRLDRGWYFTKRV